MDLGLSITRLYCETHKFKNSFISELPLEETSIAMSVGGEVVVIKGEEGLYMHEGEVEMQISEEGVGQVEQDQVQFYKKNGGLRAVDRYDHIYKQINSNSKAGTKYFACIR